VNKVKCLAIDVGDASVGVAVSDELAITARGLFTIKRTSDKDDIRKILEITREEGAKAIVVGLPLNLNGSDSVQTIKVRDFADKLANSLRSNAMADVEVILHDERFTTKIAERALIEANMSRKKRAKIIDKQAAVVILQSYIDTTRGGIGAPT
jgi:putative Holliday junction resolvase